MTVEDTPVETPVEDASTPPAEIVSDEPLGETPADTPAAPAEPVSDADDDATPPEGGTRKSRAQERIEDLASTNKLLREHNEWLREQISKGLVPADAATAPPAPAPSETEDKPTPAPTLESVGFDTTKFAEAQAAWVQAEVDRGVSRALATREAKATAQSQEQIVVESANAFRKDHKDFDLVVNNPKLQWTPTVLNALKEAGADSPALGYYLGSNPDKLAKIVKLSPQQQLLALGRLQGEIAAAPAKKPTPVAPPQKAPVKKPASTNAPPPPTPVTGAASPEIDPMKLSPSEWRKWRQQQKVDQQAGRTVRSY